VWRRAVTRFIECPTVKNCTQRNPVVNAIQVLYHLNVFLGFVKFRLSAVIKLVDINDGVHTAHADADPCVV